ncbi:threonylcarbamoyl-AMP synthase [candidate division KSB1 bacterium]|nr:MAG: threonylcarbamoyl-AMP synthase [candidate division KSB1 bacterium]
MKIYKINQEKPDLEILKKAGKIVQTGGIVIYPTETLYGIGGDPFNETTVEKIFELKKREKTKPFHYIISGLEVINEVSKELPGAFFMLIERFWPGPLTLIINRIKLPGRKKELLKPGIRVSSNIIAKKLAEYSGGILISTSANISAGKDTRETREIPDELLENADIVLDGGRISSISSSTILDLTGNKPLLLREGVIKKWEIEELIGPVI